MEQAHESPDLRTFVEMQLQGFKKLFKALLSREDNQKDDGHSVAESAFMRLMQPITANYAQRSDVAEIYNNILLLEHQAGSSTKGLSLQGLIAAVSKVALEVFSKVEWQSRFPTSKDKLRLLLFLIDNGQKYFKDHYKILQKTSAANGNVVAAARSRSGSSTRGGGGGGGDAPLPGTWKDAHYEASLIAVAQGVASSLNAYKGVVQSTPGGHDAVFRPQRPTSPVPKNTPRMKSDIEYNAAALKRAQTIAKNAEIDSAPILLSPGGGRGRQSMRVQIQSQQPQYKQTINDMRPAGNLNLSIDELEMMLSAEEEVDGSLLSNNVVQSKNSTYRSSSVITTSVHNAPVTLDELGSSFVAPVVAPFSGLDTSAVSTFGGQGGEILSDPIVTSSSSSSSSAVDNIPSTSVYATAIDGINASISKGLDRVIHDSRELRLEIDERRSLLASQIAGGGGGGNVSGVLSDRSNNVLITSRIQIADRSSVLTKTRDEVLPVLFRDAKAGGVRVHHAPVLELNNAGEEDPYSTTNANSQQSGSLFHNVDLNAESNAFLRNSSNGQSMTSSSSAFGFNKNQQSVRSSSTSAYFNSEPLSEEDLRATSQNAFFGSSLTKASSSFALSKNLITPRENEGRIPPGMSRDEFENHLRSTSSSSLSSSSLLTNLVAPQQGTSGGASQGRDDADGIGGLAASRARAAAFEKNIQAEVNNSATVHNALVLAGAQAFPDVAPGKPAVLIHHGVTGHGLPKRPDARGLLSLVNNRSKDLSSNLKGKSGEGGGGGTKSKDVVLSPVNFSTTQSILDGVPSAGHQHMQPLSRTMIQNIFASTGFLDKALFSGDSTSASSAATKGMACSAFAIHLQRSSALVKELFNHYAHFGVHSHSKIDRLPGGFIAKVNDASENGTPRMRQNAFTKFVLDAGILGRGVIGSNGAIETNQSFRHGDIAVVFSMAMARMAATESAVTSGLIPKGSVFAHPEGFSNINLLLGLNDAAPVSLTLWKSTGFTTRNVKRSMLSLGLDFPAFAHALLLCAVKRFCGRDVQILTAQGGAAALEAERRDRQMLKEYLSGEGNGAAFKGVPVNPTVELQLLLAAAVSGDEDALRSIQLTSTDPLISKNVSPTLAFRLLLLRHVLPLCVHTGYLSSVSEVQITRATELHDFLVNTALPGDEEEDDFLTKIAQKRTFESSAPKNVPASASVPPPRSRTMKSSAVSSQPQLPPAAPFPPPPPPPHPPSQIPQQITQSIPQQPLPKAESQPLPTLAVVDIPIVEVAPLVTSPVAAKAQEQNISSSPPAPSQGPPTNSATTAGSPSLMHALLSPTRHQAQLHRSNSGFGLLSGFISSTSLSSSSSSSSASKTGLNSLLYGNLPPFSAAPIPVNTNESALVKDAAQSVGPVTSRFPEETSRATSSSPSPALRLSSPCKQKADVERLSKSRSPSRSLSPKKQIGKGAGDIQGAKVMKNSPILAVPPSPHLLQSIRHMEMHKVHDYHGAVEQVLGHVAKREKEKHWSPNNNARVASEATERSPSPTKHLSTSPAPHAPHLMHHDEYHHVVENVLGHVVDNTNIAQNDEIDRHWHMNNNARVAAVATERVPSPYQEIPVRKSPRIRAAISPIARQAAENAARRVPLRIRRSFRGVVSPENFAATEALDVVSEDKEIEFDEDLASPTFRFRGMGPALFAAAGVKSSGFPQEVAKRVSKSDHPKRRQTKQPVMDANERRREYNMRRGSIPMSLGSYDSSGTGMEDEVEVLYTAGSYTDSLAPPPHNTLVQEDRENRKYSDHELDQHTRASNAITSPRAEEAAYMLLELQQPSEASEAALPSDVTSPEGKGGSVLSPSSPRNVHPTPSVQWRADVNTPPPASRIVLPGSLPSSPISDNMLSPSSVSAESPRLLTLPEETQSMRSPESGNIDAAAVLASLATPAGRPIADTERNIPSTERAQRIWQRQFEGAVVQNSVEESMAQAQSPSQSPTQNNHPSLSSVPSSSVNSPVNPHADVSTFGALFAPSPPGMTGNGGGVGGVGDRYEIRPAIGAATPGAQIAVPVRRDLDEEENEAGSDDNLMPLNTLGKNRDGFGQTRTTSSSMLSVQQRLHQHGRSSSTSASNASVSSSSTRSSQSSIPFRISVHSGGVHIDGGVGTLQGGEGGSRIAVGSSASAITTPLNFGETPAPGGNGGARESRTYTPVNTSDGNGGEDGLVSLERQRSAASPSYVLSPDSAGKSSSSTGGGRTVHTIVRLHRSGSVEITTSSPPQQQLQQQQEPVQQHLVVESPPQQLSKVQMDDETTSKVSTTIEEKIENGKEEQVIDIETVEVVEPLPTVSAILSSLKRV